MRRRLNQREMHVRIDLDVVRRNVEAIDDRVSGDIVGVVKGVDARRDVVEAFLAAGIEQIAVSRPANLSALQDIDAELMMLRIPAQAELPEVVANADVTLHGSARVLRAASAEAERQGRTHRVMPMIDAGDGREGVPLDQAADFLSLVERLEAVELAAVGVNLGCFDEAPDPERVRDVAERVPGYPLSVGGSGMLLVHEELPDAVRSYRTGDAPLTGKFVETPIDGLTQGAVTLEADVLSSRAGEAVLDIGNLSTDPRHLTPTGNVTIERWSNELTVVRGDIEDGERVAFEMGYDAIATTFHTRYL